MSLIQCLIRLRQFHDRKGQIESIGSKIAMFTRASNFNPNRDDPSTFLGGRDPRLNQIMYEIRRATEYINRMDRSFLRVRDYDSSLRSDFRNLSRSFQTGGMNNSIRIGMYNLLMKRADFLEEISQQHSKILAEVRALKKRIPQYPKNREMFRRLARLLDLLQANYTLEAFLPARFNLARGAIDCEAISVKLNGLAVVSKKLLRNVQVYDTGLLQQKRKLTSWGKIASNVVKFELALKSGRLPF